MDINIIYFFILLSFLSMFSGFISGLFGFGSAFFIIPFLFYFFHLSGLTANISMMSSVATLSAIPVYFFSIYNHYKLKNLDRFRVYETIFGVLLGSSSGIFIIKFFNIMNFKYGIVLLQIFTTLYFFLKYKNVKISKKNSNDLSNNTIFFIIIIFTISLITTVFGMGIILFVAFLVFLGVSPFKISYLTSFFSAILSIVNLIFYIFIGLFDNVDIKYSFSYINLPVVICMTFFMFLTTNFGVKFSYYISINKMNLSLFIITFLTTIFSIYFMYFRIS